MNNTFYIESLGCIANLSDTTRITNFLKLNGWENTNEPAGASVIILMTCAFTTFAEDVNIKRLQELKELKGSGSSIIVGGCLPAINKNRLKKEFNGFVFTPRQLSKLDSFFNPSISIDNIAPICDDPDGNEIKAIRVSTGCLNNCTYCSIPFANGRVKSREINTILDDIKKCIKDGSRHIKLVSEDIGAYGQDHSTTIIELLKSIISIDSDFTLYLDNYNPNWFYKYKAETLEILENPKLARTLYIPIQSGSDKILDLMKREYNAYQVLDVLDSLNSSFKGIVINTDFIVGFPTESEEDFLKSKEILENFEFNHVEFFTYQERPNTAALKLNPKVSEETKTKRQRELINLHFSKYLTKNNISNFSSLKEHLETISSLPVNFNF